ncbi:TetR/AcrR family transcriptional regulator [Caulobacter segnis]|uniref:Transcriptional regulator, TetR family n=2 Tax=Caulobacter segnis TaxID=88688 RepID=D5VPA2_CAUST|nr:TetR/AcrR family transcriptional regulator [Caulobacter segnis]ADG12325.1 transcriptional regulator, TetR family [Caulobacter segnis ATCC 21756]AVQ03918.1 TetR/AcrR family transcriptional regulator [Caulobacter segnis]
MLALRARGKARRCAEIIAAASALWRERGIENVSLSQIAAAAQVAPQTIYNLIGGLDAIALAVVNVAVDRIETAMACSAATGVELALEASSLSAALYVADAALYRQVLVRIPRVLFGGTRLGREPADVVVHAMAQARAAGVLQQTVDPARLGRTIYSNYLGAIYDWACGDASDAMFLATAKVAVLAPVVACASDAARPELSARLLACLADEGGGVADRQGARAANALA